MLPLALRAHASVAANTCHVGTRSSRGAHEHRAICRAQSSPQPDAAGLTRDGMLPDVVKVV